MRHIAYTRVAVLTIFSLFSLTTYGNGGGAIALSIEWSAMTSPPGGGIWSMTMAPSNSDTIYAATRDFNVLKTTDGGTSWSILGERRFGAHIFADVLVHPSDANHLYASNGALHETTDGGANWTTLLAESDITGFISSIALDPVNTSILYAGTTTGIIYRSADGGTNWSLLSTILSGSTIAKLIHHPTDGATLYAQVTGSGIYKSADSGTSWTLKNNGFTNPTGINFFKLDPSSSTTLFVGTSDSIFKTTDSAENWTDITPSGPRDVFSLGISADGQVLYAGLENDIFKSSNGGTSWSQATTPSTWKPNNGYNVNVDILVDPIDSNKVYIGKDDGFLKSTDGGASWTDINNGVVDDMVFSLAVDPKDSNKLWVGNFWTRGIFITEDGGSTWSLLDAWRHASQADHYPMEIVINTSDTDIVYVTGAYGLKKTTDGGTTWSSLGDQGIFKDEHTHGLAMDPSNSSVIYVGTGPGWDQTERGSHVYKTTDGGTTWTDLPGGFPTGTEGQAYVIGVAPSNSNIVYVGNNGHDDCGCKHEEESGVLKSSDGGATWEQVNSGLPNLNVYTLAVHPTDPNIVYIGLGHGNNDSVRGVYQTSNGGGTWNGITGLPDDEVSHIEFHPTNSNIIIISFGANRCAGCDTTPSGSGVYGTEDGGTTWTDLSSALWTSRQKAVMDVVFDSTGSIVYAGTDDGIFIGTLAVEIPTITGWGMIILIVIIGLSAMAINKFPKRQNLLKTE